MTDFHIIIPARYASSRLPAKMLADIAGKSMIERVYEQAIKSKASSVTIATDDDRIKALAENFGARVVMTSNIHESGTARLAEAVTHLGLNDEAIVVNVQGDQPLVPVSSINLVATSLANQNAADMASVCAPLQRREDLFNPNFVKVVRDKNGCALYFSRATIPWDRDGFAINAKGESVDLTYYFQHMGLYAYRAHFIKRYSEWEASPLENIEALEQLRVLWHGEKIYMAITDEIIPPEVNTPEDLEVVRAVYSA